jgi:flagellar hook-length control protein FliK
VNPDTVTSVAPPQGGGAAAQFGPRAPQQSSDAGSGFCAALDDQIQSSDSTPGSAGPVPGLGGFPGDKPADNTRPGRKGRFDLVALIGSPADATMMPAMEKFLAWLKANSGKLASAADTANTPDTAKAGAAGSNAAAQNANPSAQQQPAVIAPNAAVISAVLTASTSNLPPDVTPSAGAPAAGAADNTQTDVTAPKEAAAPLLQAVSNVVNAVKVQSQVVTPAAAPNVPAVDEKADSAHPNTQSQQPNANLDNDPERAAAIAALRSALSSKAADAPAIQVSGKDAHVAAAPETAAPGGTGTGSRNEQSGQHQQESAAPAPVLPATALDQHVTQILQTIQSPQTVAAIDHAVRSFAATATGSNEAPALTLPNVDLSHQIVQGVRLQWQDGVGDAKITLQPDYLGEVSVSLRVSDGGVTATLHADSAAVRSWIEANEPALRQALADQGLTLHKLTVADDPPSKGLQQDGRDPAAQQEHQQQQQPRQQHQRRAGDAQKFEIVM